MHGSGVTRSFKRRDARTVLSVAPTALSPEAEIPAAPTRILLGPAPEHGGQLGAGIGHAAHRGRAPPALPA